MYDTGKLLKQIETLRNQMTDVALTKGITSLESIALSQELDRLLNIYNELESQNSNYNKEES